MFSRVLNSARDASIEVTVGGLSSATVFMLVVMMPRESRETGMFRIRRMSSLVSSRVWFKGAAFSLHVAEMEGTDELEK